MKILLLHNYYLFPSGEERYFESLVRLLKKGGHKVIVYTKSNKDIKKSPIELFKLVANLFYNKKAEKELGDLIIKEKPELAHFNNIFPLITPTAYRVCKKYNVPIAQTVHNYRLLCPGSYLFKNGKECVHYRKGGIQMSTIINNCYKNSYLQSFILSLSIIFHKKIGSFNMINKYLFPAPFTLKIHRRFLNVPDTKAFIIRYFLPAIKLSKEKKYKGKYFVYAGQLREEKGVLELLDVFKSLPQLNCVIIGHGILQNKVDKFKRYSNIKVVPFVSRKTVLEYMRDAYCTIVTSKWFEVGPLVAIESYSVGTPVIGPNVGVFKDVIENGKSGYLFKNNDWKNFKQIVLKAWGNQKTLGRMKSEAKVIFKNNYTESIHAKKLTFVYNQLINETK